MKLSVKYWVIRFVGIVGMMVIMTSVTCKIRAERETSAKDSITEGLVGWWGFDEGKGDKAEDKSGNGNHGEIFNAPQWVEGKIGSALQFDGVDDYIRIEHLPSLDIKDAITIEMWVKPAAADIGGLIWKGNHPYYSCYGISKFYGLAGAFKLHFMDTKGESEHFHMPIPYDNQWHHIAVTWDGKKWKLLVDGGIVAEGERTGTLVTNTECLNIGGRPGSFYFKGIIDEVRLYNRGLKGSELFNNYSIAK